MQLFDILFQNVAINVNVSAFVKKSIIEINTASLCLLTHQSYPGAWKLSLFKKKKPLIWGVTNDDRYTKLEKQIIWLIFESSNDFSYIVESTYTFSLLVLFKATTEQCLRG